jgi:hypothetical protein
MCIKNYAAWDFNSANNAYRKTIVFCQLAKTLKNALNLKNYKATKIYQ